MFSYNSRRWGTASKEPAPARPAIHPSSARQSAHYIFVLFLRPCAHLSKVPQVDRAVDDDVADDAGDEAVGHCQEGERSGGAGELAGTRQGRVPPSGTAGTWKACRARRLKARHPDPRARHSMLTRVGEGHHNLRQWRAGKERARGGREGKGSVRPAGCPPSCASTCYEPRLCGWLHPACTGMHAPAGAAQVLLCHAAARAGPPAQLAAHHGEEGGHRLLHVLPRDLGDVEDHERAHQDQRGAGGVCRARGRGKDGWGGAVARVRL